jgi:hypothetical protein
MKLNISEPERAKFATNNELGADSHGNEVLIGLDYDESNRHVRYLRGPMHRRTRDEAADARYLLGRHQRAMIFWKLAIKLPDCLNEEMSAEGAFEVGREAWNAHAGATQLSDFSKMIGTVPLALRLAALNGWLNAFDDEADRLNAANKRDG